VQEVKDDRSLALCPISLLEQKRALTGHQDGEFGSDDAAQMPIEGSDGEATSVGMHDEPSATVEHADEQDEIPRHTKPFRAWGAAQEAPSVGERFSGWLSGLFSRKKPAPSDSGEISHESTDEIAAYSATPSGMRASFDDLEAPWPDDAVAEEKRSRRPSSERPSFEDFEARLETTYDSVDEPVLETAGEDALWDEPRTVEPSPPPPGFESKDLEAVWSAESDRTPQVETPKAERKGFFARLFGKKERSNPAPTLDAAIEESWGTGYREESVDPAAAVEPADADFADDVAAAAAPADADFMADQIAASAPVDSDFADEVAAAEPSSAEAADEEGSDAADEPEVEPEPEPAETSDVVFLDTDAPTMAIDAAVVAIETEVVESYRPVLDPAEFVEPAEAPKRPSLIQRLFGKRQSKPSLDHSAADAAKLAAALGPLTPLAEEWADAPADDSPTEIVAVVAEIHSEPEPAETVQDDEDEQILPLAQDYGEEQATTAAENDSVVAEPEADQRPTVEVSLESETFVEEEEQVLRFAQDDDQPVAQDDVKPVEEKKPGFFSALLRRFSRPIPRIAEPPEVFEKEERETDALEVAADASEPAVADVDVPPAESIELETRWGRPAEPESALESEPEPEPVVDAADASDADEDVDVIEAVVEIEEAAPPVAAIEEASTLEFAPPPMPSRPASAPARSELDSTQPFPAFRDARDDFEEAADSVTDSGRPTEEVPVVPDDEGEKTDEFAVVPPAEGSLAEATARTIQLPGFFGRLFGKKAASDTQSETASGETVAAAPLGSATPAPVDDKLPFVLAKFRTFYNEIIRDKHQKSDVISGFATAIVSAPASDMADPDFAAALLSKRLSEMLELQEAESNWTGGDAAKYFPEAKYAMVCLADETFATFDWPGRPAWHKYMLEPKLYGSRAAELEFFKRIDKLLKDNPDPEKGARDLARLYLMVIASGFKGKFRVPNVSRPLAEYRRRLYEFSHRADPLELYGRERRIFPQASDNVLESRAIGRFTPAQKWAAALLILVALYIGTSHVAWRKLSADLRDVLTRIELIQPAASAKAK
jgi:type IV/VI secretion system ImpK/VasF family protein